MKNQLARIGVIAISSIGVLCVASMSFAQPVQWKVEDGGNGHYYEAIFVPGGITWTDANEQVQSLGSCWHLATVTSEEENNFIYSLFSDDPSFYSCCDSSNGNGPWLGGFSSGNGMNDWQWVTGEAFSFSKWGPLEPFGNGDRISYFGYHTSTVQDVWNDVPDGYVSTRPPGYIIETSTNPDPPDYAIIDGSVTYKGNSLCSMVLANGQHMFTCGDDLGIYNLDVPLDNNCLITLYVFTSGFAPYKAVMSPLGTQDLDIVMNRAPEDSREMEVAYQTEPGTINPNWVRINGTVAYEWTPLCAMVLANGQKMFSCGDDTGTFDLEVPLDENGEITLYVFCSGMAPYKDVFEP